MPAESARADAPSTAQVVVVGGGVIGCSVAYHLTKAGCRDVLLLERKSIGSGTSWHSLGVVGVLRQSKTTLKLALETASLLPRLERETGKSTGYSVRGSVNVTTEPARLQQYRRFVDLAGSVGLPAAIVDPAEAQRLWPRMSVDDLIGAVHLPSEGQCNPLDLTQAYLAGARQGGVRVVENLAVRDLKLERGAVVGVETDAGTIRCETVINCGGLWARDLARGRLGGAAVQAVEHNYVVTEFSEKIAEGMAILRDPDRTLTVREDARQFSVGFNERRAKLFAKDAVPEDFAFDQLPPDHEAALPYLEDAMRRVPLLADLGIRLFMCGPESVTPDTRYLLGPVPGVANYFIAAGFSGFGIGNSGGAGRALADWVVSGAPQDDLWDVDVRRVPDYQRNRSFLQQRAVEASGKLFAMNWPHRQVDLGRRARRSPLHALLAKAGACFGEVAGWETADWFAGAGERPRHSYSFDKPDWFPKGAAEARAAFESAAIADRSLVSKFLVVGDGAEAALSTVTSRDPAIAPGSQRLTLLLNEAGGVEAIMTLLRLTQESFLLLSEAPCQVRDLDLLRRRLAACDGVSVVDATSAFGLVEIIGPEAEASLRRAGWRGRLARPNDCDPEAEIGFAPVRLGRNLRLSRPSWFLLTPSESSVAMAEGLLAAASEGARLIGRHVYHFLRTSAPEPVWGLAVGDQVSPFEVGLDCLVELSGARPFIGREAALAASRDAPERGLVALCLDDQEAVLHGDEPLLRDGDVIGDVVQAAYPFLPGHAVALGICRGAHQLVGQRLEVLLAGRRCAAQCLDLAVLSGASHCMSGSLDVDSAA